MNEKKAIELCIYHRDPAGFEFLVKKFKREAFFHALSFTGNPEDAADMCQESFSKAYKAFPGLTYLNRFYPWFYSILRNTSLNFIKKKKRLADKSYEIFNRKDAKTESPEDKYEDSELNSRLWQILFKMKADFREILVLKYVENKKYEEISMILGIPRGTVMSRLYNARKKFREIYLLKEEKNDK